MQKIHVEGGGLMQKIPLRGGSLSGTYLCLPPDDAPFVRKEISLSVNREYGFQRWYSQLKRLQRYSVLFPGLFPEMQRYGRTGDSAYFDLEYVDGAVTVQEFLCATEDKGEVDVLFTELFRVIDHLHKVRIPSTSDSLSLYIYEEIEQKIKACSGNALFSQFARHSSIIFNGQKVPPFWSVLDD